MRRKRDSASRKEIKTRLLQELVKKYGFEKKFIVKEIIEEKIKRASASELFSFALIKENIENEIKKIVIKKSGKGQNDKKLRMLNGNFAYNYLISKKCKE